MDMVKSKLTVIMTTNCKMIILTYRLLNFYSKNLKTTAHKFTWKLSFSGDFNKSKYERVKQSTVVGFYREWGKRIFKRILLSFCRPTKLNFWALSIHHKSAILSTCFTLNRFFCRRLLKISILMLLEIKLRVGRPIMDVVKVYCGMSSVGCLMYN